ncbi:hypothetical protein PB1_16384 [Bacillus methanolicus PB1]|uniref:Fur-regulated basic protein FbpA n=1 Tax=Bacillus methanolicus PB1 TaxID=997296 RepID=I3DY31_BACMT|nr:hypothetical protein PB1_16384 [Bacillus methanolicus PB1]
MGILYDKVMVTKEAKRQIFISCLLEKGITATKDGTSIYDLDYYDLRLELVKVDFRESPENRWF